MTSGTLVDSNVLLDILTNDDKWSEWSTEALAQTADAGPLYINPVIYADVSIRFSTVEALEDALPSQTFSSEPTLQSQNYHFSHEIRVDSEPTFQPLS